MLLRRIRLIPVFFDKTGNPFVFLEFCDRPFSIHIRHGEIVYSFYCISDTNFQGHPWFYNTDKDELFLYGQNGRTIASFLPKENVLVIKRDGKVNALALVNYRIAAFSNERLEKRKDLLEHLDNQAVV